MKTYQSILSLVCAASVLTSCGEFLRTKGKKSEKQEQTSEEKELDVLETQSSTNNDSMTGPENPGDTIPTTNQTTTNNNRVRKIGACGIEGITDECDPDDNVPK